MELCINSHTNNNNSTILLILLMKLLGSKCKKKKKNELNRCYYTVRFLYILLSRLYFRPTTSLTRQQRP